MRNDDVHEIKTKLNIADVVGDYVALRRKGQTLWGRCPFHNEKTPSFSVSEERQTFHCFGCGKGGDIFTFVMEMEHLEFRDALEKLAEQAGVKLTRFGSAGVKKKKTLSDINLIAHDFFREQLFGSGGEAARAYLKRRNISAETARRFEIGWAPSSWDGLYNRLAKEGFSDGEIIDGGFAIAGNRGPYDRFRGRVMFPIHNISDKLIGFGGRILDGDGAKYLNSPESAVFNKRENLYLLNKAKNSARQSKSLILVEGYMDAIRAHLAGFTNTAASLGTALTDAQAALIKRMTDLCYICYDSDSAGQEAALRGMYVLQKQNVSVKVVRLGEDKDPDDILSSEGGVEIFKKALQDALPLPVYHAVLRGEDLKHSEKESGAREDLLDGLSSLSDLEIEPHLNRLGQILGIFQHDLKREIDKRKEKIRGGNRSRMPETVSGDRQEDDADELECVLCSMLWSSEDLRADVDLDQTVPFISDENLQNIVSALLTGETPTALEARWRQMNDARCLRLVAKGNGIIANQNLEVNTETADIIINTLRKRCMENRLETLLLKMKKGVATDAEFKEHFELSRILKKGALKDEKR